MAIRIINFSDFHFNIENYRSIYAKRSAVVSRIKSVCDSNDFLIFIFSGDVSNTGIKEDFNLAQFYIDELFEDLKGVGKRQFKYFVPGNHDCILPEESEDINFEDVKTKSIFKKIEILNEKQKEFWNFNTRNSSTTDQKNSLIRIAYLDIEDVFISIKLLNTAWMSKRHEEKIINIPSEFLELDETVNIHNKKCLSILVHHHPNSWFKPIDDLNYKDRLRKSVNLIISGHEHIGEIARTDTSESSVLYLNAGEMSGDKSTFFVLKYDNNVMTSLKFYWDQKIDNFERKNEIQSEINNNNALNFTNDFQAHLNDFGMLVLHPRKKNVTLFDLFVIPYLSFTESSKSKESILISDSESINKLTSKGKYIVEGEYGSGKTSLSKYLTSKLLGNGKLPILISSKEIIESCNSEVRINNKLKTILQNQFGEKFSEVQNFSKSDTFLIVDDYNLLLENEKIKENFNKFVMMSYENIILFVNSSIGFSSNIKQIRDFIDFKIYELESFGPKLINNLVEKWYKLENYESSEFELKKYIEEKSQVIKNLLKHSSIPSTPHSIITILSTGDSYGTNKDTTLYGFLLKILISNSFKNAGIKDDDHYEVFEIMYEFAYKIYKSDDKQATFKELRLIIENFNVEHRSKINISSLLKKLIIAKVIQIINLNYFEDNEFSEDIILRFKYDYLYSYFVSKFISDNLSQSNVKEELERMIDDIHIESNSRIIVNMWYFRYDELLMELLQSKINRTLNSHKIYEFEEPAKCIKYINDSRKEIISSLREIGQSVEKNKEDLLEKEEYESHVKNVKTDGELNDNEFNEMMIELNTAFNLMNCIGQIIKCYGGIIKAKNKSILIINCYTLGMKSISSLLEMFSDNTEFLEYAKNLMEKSRNIDIQEIYDKSLKKIRNIIQMGILGTILKISESISTDKLELSINDFDDQNDRIAVKLISLASSYVFLNKEKSKQVLELADKIEQDFLTYDILRIIVWRYYYYNDPQNRVEMDKLFLKLEINKKSMLLSNMK